MPMLTFCLLLYCTINTRKYVLRLNSGNFFYLDLNYAKKSCSPNIFRKAAEHNFMKNSVFINSVCNFKIWQNAYRPRF